MIIRRSTYIAVSCSALLVACGGGGGSTSAPGGGGTVTPQSYETLDSTAAASSTLAGAALRQNRSVQGSSAEVARTSGTLEHATGATTLSDGQYTLLDSNGTGTGNTLTDGSAIFVLVDDSLHGGDYEYVTYYEGAYISGGDVYDTQGTAGVVTDARDVPSGGTATYTGGARGTLNDGFALTRLVDGRSVVNADFGAGVVDVEIDGFSGEDIATGRSRPIFLDRIVIEDMAISGNQFSGGRASGTFIGTPSPDIGTVVRTEAEGNFFGFDQGIGAPDEVGGVFDIGGTSGAVTGTFLAD